MLGRFIRKSILRKILLIESILIILSTPFVFTWTYANGPEVITQTVTYTINRLDWDQDTVSLGNRLKIFDEIDQSVLQTDERLIAPGTSGEEVIRLENRANQPIEYTAIMYYKQKNADIPISIFLSSTAEESVDGSEEMIDAKIVRVVHGEVDAFSLENFTLQWNWPFEENHDLSDTYIGDLATETDIQATIGFKLIVSTDEIVSTDVTSQIGSDHIRYKAPKTGVQSWVKLYLILLVCSILTLLWLWIERENDEEKNQA